MAEFEHGLKSFDVGAQLQEFASVDTPAYRRRCFSEGDAILDDRNDEIFERELICERRAQSWQRSLERDKPENPGACKEVELWQIRLSSAR